MKLTKYIFILVSIFFVLSVQLAEAQISYGSPVVNQNATYAYTVKMGETAYSIATSHGIKVEDIYRLNPGTDKGLKSGQEIQLPIQNKEGQQANAEQSTHTIEPKETLYSVSQKYGTTVFELLRLNPGLSESSFNIGRVINIPTGKPMKVVDVAPSDVDVAFAKSTLIQHKVGKKETLYNISKKYNVSIEEIERLNPTVKEFGLKEGSVLSIPVSSSSFTEMGLRRVEDLNPDVFYPKDGIVRIALLLPFREGSKLVSKEKIEEYYEGFLLAVQKMKEQGLKAEIYTFDIGTDSDTRRLESILATNELNDLNLIIGGVSERQIKLISSFSQKTGTNYVVPFNNRGTGVLRNRSEFQVANSHTNLFPKVAAYFANRFRDYNIIFTSVLGSNKDKKDFVKVLQEELQTRGISYKMAPTSASITDDLNSVVDKTKKNILIPSSHSETELKRLLDGMDVLSREKEMDMSLFGYPEWQTYINLQSRLHRHNTYFYSIFYLDSKSPAAQIFSDKYRKWFNKPLVVTYPKFAHMGYDTGLLFLTGLQKYGHRFSPYINNLGVQTLQSSMYFEPAGQDGGYINSGLYLIHLKPDNSVEKNEIK